MQRTPTALLTLALLLAASPAAAFVYLEHSWLTDRACHAAQETLSADLSTPDRRARYLALALYCPATHTPTYCAHETKQAVGSLNLLPGPPGDSEEVSVTLGDLSALGDHLTRFGPYPRLPAAGDGLLREVVGWLTAPAGGPGGIIEDVSEEACEGDLPIPWAEIDNGVAAFLADQAADRLPTWPPALLAPWRRAEPVPGPEDPDTLYTFDNPHYLDLVLENRHHFGDGAHRTWVGFHRTAQGLAGLRCADVYALDADDTAALAEGLPEFSGVDFDELASADEQARLKGGFSGRLAERGCAALRRRLLSRLLVWRARAEPMLVAPVRDALARLETHPDDPLLDAVASAFLALPLESVGLHFLQDAMSAGHLRQDDAPAGLKRRRHRHDADGRYGVTTALITATSTTPYVAFGDSFLLSVGPTAPRCRPENLTDASPETVTACLLWRQRGLMVAATAASLLDFAAGGVSLSPRPADALPEPLEDQVRRSLPLRSSAQALTAPGPAPTELPPADLPIAPPPFDYEALLATVALDASGGRPTLGSRLVLLTQLGEGAPWMRSYQVGLLTRIADHPDLTLDFAHAFHWRWAARFLVDAAPFVYLGGKNLGDDGHLAFGLGPAVGVTLLPEGWIKFPLQISLGYRMPLELLNSDEGAAVQVGGHFVEVGLGMAVF